MQLMSCKSTMERWQLEVNPDTGKVLGQRDREREGTQYSVKQVKIAFEALKNPLASSSVRLQALVNYEKSNDYIPHTRAHVHKLSLLSLSLSLKHTLTYTHTQSNTQGFLQAKSDF